MKKILFIVICLFSFLIVPSVQAEEVSLDTLIPVDTKVTVHTEKFDYIDFSFSSQVNEAGNGKIQFDNIKNNTMGKAPVSINILLFGADQKNIGYLTYCTDRDIGNDNAGFKLKGGESSPFTITITSKYFIDGKKPSDVSFIAVHDENKYCQVGGYTNYENLTIEEIRGDVVEDSKFDIMSYISKFLSYFQKDSRYFFVLLGLCIFMGLFLFGLLFNSLYKKMYGKGSIFSFLPITNIYVCMKMSFGRIVALIFMVFYLVSVVLYYFKITIILPIMSGLWGLSIIVVIIKLITKNYDLFYFEPSMDTSVYTNTNIGKDPFSEDSTVEKIQPTLDLSYNDTNSIDNTLDPFISSGDGLISQNQESNEKEEDEMDLSDFFH